MVLARRGEDVGAGLRRPGCESQRSATSASCVLGRSLSLSPSLPSVTGWEEGAPHA